VTAPQARAGFTLVEVLVALALFALIAAASITLLTVASTTRDAVAEQSARLFERQRARQLLKADIGQATARPVRGAGGEEPALLGGDGQRLLSVTRAGWWNHADRLRSSLQRIDYVLIDGRLERRAHRGVDGGPEPQPQVLLTDVQAVEVGFVSGGAETPQWPAQAARPLPDAVRVVLTLKRYGRVEQWFLVGAGPG
jgi:general secretion pathway protein J